MRLLAPLMLALALPCGALWAEDAPVLAEYRARSGSLPPEYAWSLDITIRLDGALLLKHCKGYASDGPACSEHQATVEPAKIKAIETAVVASRLAKRPARSVEMPPVGGGTTAGTVYHGGVEIALPAFPAKRDVARVGKVLDAMADAVPDDLRQRFLGGN